MPAIAVAVAAAAQTQIAAVIQTKKASINKLAFFIVLMIPKTILRSLRLQNLPDCPAYL